MAVSQVVILLWVLITGGTWQVPNSMGSHKESRGKLFALRIWRDLG